ncbi:hypothetical protein Pla110_22800 [Polystyrenella longa]|uniref:BON domain protein n=1 Tax=Polystyrenella longa TaxID=2528007 RepID=A0A518CMV4_9PLAN|nr:hypothetical protein [Polystyrenella longa]QDU80549.1 hypothetical protein Pla110_22800 [Polystyrenella longa]
MTVQTLSVDSHELLAQRINHLVKSRTGAPIRELFVEVDDQEVLLYGYTTAYYNKQLASHVVMNVIDNRSLINKIEVI